jgi:hypothetical protein
MWLEGWTDEDAEILKAFHIVPFLWHLAGPS